jgi:hypothetical protein
MTTKAKNSEARIPNVGVSASMATIPQRVGMLRLTLDSLLPQLDRLDVYLNNWEDIPDFLEHPKIRLARSQKNGDRRDNGKFFFLLTEPDETPGWHFLVDDDIIYPADYVRRMISAMDLHGNRVVVGVHGVILAEPMERFFSDRKVYHFQEANPVHRPVNLLGSGTAAWPRSLLHFGDSDIGESGMADLWLAILAKRECVPQVAVARSGGWLREQPHPVSSPTLWKEFRRNDSRQTAIARQHGPWGFAVAARQYRTTLERVFGHVPDSDLARRDIDVRVLRPDRDPVVSRSTASPS